MICPNCGGKTKVQETRTDGELVIRHRKCPGCKLRFRTAEAVDDEAIKRKGGQHE